MITDFPSRYTKICIKQPLYQNDEFEVYWDSPEYAGYDRELENGPLRPDGKIINKRTKIICVLEMSIPWIENRKIKIAEKEDKYTNIIQSLKIANPGYLVKQLTFIVDSMEGYSSDFINNLTLHEEGYRFYHTWNSKDN